MGKFVIEQSSPLAGRVRVCGAKNSVLPIMAGTLLTDGKCVLREVPSLTDVSVMAEIIADLGSKTEWNPKKQTLVCESGRQDKHDERDYELAGKMRASFAVMGALLARDGFAKMPLPGGCCIGSRPIELHLKGFAALGAKIGREHGFVTAAAKRLRGANVYLDFPSVGATENIMTAAVLADGQTVIQNCAVEPEIVDLANFLNALGADVRGSGTDTIRINGVSSLHGAEYSIIPDRIEAGTFMVAAAMTGGDIHIENVCADHLKPVTAKLSEMGVSVEYSDSGVHVYNKTGRLRAIDIKTMPYPGFPTDMQAQFMALLAVTRGASVVTETVFENRFMHAAELKRMGAEILIEGRTAVVEGVKKMEGAQVRATDLRAGAALVLAGLCSGGTTEIADIHHIDRGYCKIDEKLRKLGAKIERVD